MTTSKFARTATAQATAQTAAPRTRRAAKVEPVAVQDVEFIETPADTSTADKVFGAYAEARDNLFKQLNVPTPGRFVAALLTSILAGCCANSAIWSMVDIVLLSSVVSTSLFLWTLICLLGFALAMYASYMASKHAFAYVMSRKVNEHYATVRGYVGGLFRRNPVAA